MSLRRWPRWMGVLGAGAAGIWAGCVSPTEEPGSKVPSACELEAPLVAPQKTDILFVIDNSGSMADEQQKVAEQLPLFVDELKKGGGVGHDFQVGVITTSVYQNANLGTSFDYREFPAQAGRLQGVPDGSGMPTGERVLRSDDAALVEKFSALVKQGTMGSGQETPFEAVRLAVATDLANKPQAEGGNAGFLRDDARLLVVVVTDEDDCSEMERPPSVFVGTSPTTNYCDDQEASLSRVVEYANLFKELKDSTGAARQVLWAAIAPVSRGTKEAAAEVGDGHLRNVDCPTSYQPGYRQREMASLFDATLGNLDSICADSYQQSLLAIAQIANATQSIEVSNVPDERLLKVEITRANGDVQACTIANGGIEYEAAAEDRPARVFFTGQCPRKFDDTAVQLKMICAG